MTFFAVLIGCALVGYTAQSAKGRTGLLWAMGTFGLALPWWFFIAVVMTTGHVTGEFDGIDNAALDFTKVLAVAVPPTFVMLLGVATLPRPKEKTRT